MDAIQKLLKKMSREDKRRVLSVLRMVEAGTLSGIKLSGKEQYRIRVGKYRIIYCLEKGNAVIVAVRRRNEDTYK